MVFAFCIAKAYKDDGNVGIGCRKQYNCSIGLD